MTKPGLSDNVGGVKHFSSTLLYALREERHFALVEGVAFSNRRLARNPFRSGHSVRPMHLFGRTRDHDYYFELPRKRGAGCPINYSVLDCTPWPGSSWPACEPNFFTRS